MADDERRALAFMADRSRRGGRVISRMLDQLEFIRALIVRAFAACSSGRVRRSNRMFNQDRGFDCQTCGACCVSPYTGDAYVALDDDEATCLTLAQLPVILQRQGGDPPEVVPKLGTKLSANAMNVCVALEGIAGSRCCCVVYETRPNACRQFEAGSKVCREARRRIGLPC